MYNLKMFTTEDELCELTGLPPDNYHEALWNAGFILDDWDVGFESDKPMHHTYVLPEEDRAYSAYFGEEDDGTRAAINDDAWWLGNRMEEYCVGYQCTEYNGKYYYLVYHS